MKLKAALLAVTLAVAPLGYAATSEPPQTPAGGAPEAGLGVGGAVGLGIATVVVITIATGDDDDNNATGTGTGTGTGTQ